MTMGSGKRALVFVAGMPSQVWFPPIYLCLFGPHPPETVEAAILGMPLIFDSSAARGAEATIQFRVEGDDGGDFWVRVAGGECESSEGRVASPDLTIVTQGSLWLRIARGELDGAQALLDRQYSIEGDGAILTRFGEWFPSRRRSPHSPEQGKTVRVSAGLPIMIGDAGSRLPPDLS